MGVLEEGQTIVAEAWKRDVSTRLDDHFEKIEEFGEKFKRGNDRFERGEKRIEEVADEVGKANEAISKNTEITERIEEKVDRFLTIFEALEGFITVGGWMGKLVLFVAAVVVALGILYWVWKTGDLPKKP